MQLMNLKMKRSNQFNYMTEGLWNVRINFFESFKIMRENEIPVHL